MSDNKTREQIQAEVAAAAKKQARGETMKRVGMWGGALLVLVAMVVGLALLASKSPTASSGTLADPVTTADWIRGNPNAKVELVEYSDFQCPYCRIYESYVNDIMNKYGDKLKLVYREYPLTQAHEHADLAARVAEAAGLQNKFWEMHDVLFDKQTEWEHANNAEDLMKGYAATLGLDIAKFTADANGDAVRKAIQEDFASGNHASVEATPTFYLNGSKLNLSAYADLEPAVAAALK